MGELHSHGWSGGGGGGGGGGVKNATPLKARWANYIHMPGRGGRLSPCLDRRRGMPTPAPQTSAP